MAQLRALCNELESQIQDYELINQQFEKKESEWVTQKQTFEKAVEERDEEIELLHRQHNTEKNARYVVKYLAHLVLFFQMNVTVLMEIPYACVMSH